MKNSPLLSWAFGLWLAGTVSAENWAQWRGPAFNGSSPETRLPVAWSTNQNMAWTAPLPGHSGATPIIWGNAIFVTSPDAQKDLHLLCLNRQDGALRWQRKVSTGDRTIGMNNMASPSPATDGQTVFVLFGTGDLAAFDFDGKELWHRNLAGDFGKFALMWIYGSSPLLFQDRLYIQLLQRNPPEYSHALDDKPARESFLLCLDPKTGRDLWRQVRVTDSAKESMEAYTTPIPHTGRQGTELLVVGGDHVSGHRPDNGQELWRARLHDVRNDYFRIVPSAVGADGLIIACGPKGQPVVAFKEGGRGNVTKTHLAWSFKENPTDWSTPLYYQKKLYVLDGGKRVLSRLDPATGQREWSGNLGVTERIWASPTGADGKIYVISERGTTIVCAADSEFKILATNRLEENPTRASVAVSGGQLFLRTARNLYCVGKP
jgi:outer membrane protein assembly factor BamB